MGKYRILILNKISSHGLKRLPAESYETGSEVTNPDAILVRSARMHEMDIPPTVRAIGRAGAGTNNIPVAEMSKRGVVVFNTPGANANAVKELVLAGMLMAARNIAPAMKFVAALQGDDASLAAQVEEGKKPFAGIELPGRMLGIIGLGSVGGMVADTALKLGMKVQGYDPDITVDAAWRLSSDVKRAHSIDDVFRHSDFITLHVPLVDATRQMVNAERVGLMKHGAVLVNFSREGVIDEQAVLDGLESKKLRAYVCDFPTVRMKSHPGVIALPHLGASTQEAEDNCAVMVVEQVREFLENGNIGYSVNFPSVQMPRESAFRMAIANANVPNMLGQISTAMAEAGLNIHNMVNKSRGEMAYTLVDLDSPVPKEVVAKISSIDGVLNVRTLPVIEN
ncbi:3-phosphoglycerate dehydrogenase [Methylobacillus sp. MM3]|uniref:phosphoglycerate dehydrogenase n=1 Tax=Methylobacillus sp. MM3 TaxID=1848039 RepID=UPI0007E0C7E6|nr:phosphoglycerate dehydrogenase [Methylobacillus sp. MM3]OAJ71183.1 3-phosphoglycerate dehydrogenase [Methylobacillus sp. MM3]